MWIWQKVQAVSWTIRLKPDVHAVVGILRRDDKVLIAERPVGKPYSGYWEFPGGKVEPGEDSKTALVRELHEELGIDVIHAEHWFEHSHIYPDKAVYLEIWQISTFHGEPHSKENQQLKWVTMTDIFNMKMLDGNWPIIDKIQAKSAES